MDTQKGKGYDAWAVQPTCLSLMYLRENATCSSKGNARSENTFSALRRISSGGPGHNGFKLCSSLSSPTCEAGVSTKGSSSFALTGNPCDTFPLTPLPFGSLRSFWFEATDFPISVSNPNPATEADSASTKNESLHSVQLARARLLWPRDSPPSPPSGTPPCCAATTCVPRWENWNETQGKLSGRCSSVVAH